MWGAMPSATTKKVWVYDDGYLYRVSLKGRAVNPNFKCPHKRFQDPRTCLHCIRLKRETAETERPPPLDAPSEARLAWAKRIEWIRRRWNQ